MTDLITCLSTGKGTWTNVLNLVKKEEFENVFLIVNTWTKDKLQLDRENLNFILIDDKNDSHEVMRDKIINGLKGRIKGLEAALNIDSGSGKEHTAIITALLKLGLAPRFVIDKDGAIVDLSGGDYEFGY